MWVLPGKLRAKSTPALGAVAETVKPYDRPCVTGDVPKRCNRNLTGLYSTGPVAEGWSRRPPCDGHDVDAEAISRAVRKVVPKVGAVH